MTLIYTVGHSTSTPEHFVKLLLDQRVTAVADIRSAPYSRFAPQFNQDNMRKELAKHAIDYVFLGRELGARSDDPNAYVDHQVQYSRIAASKSYRSGIDRLLAGANQHSIAVTCTEKDPIDCHRTVLVSETLRKLGVRVRHVLSDGSTESHEEAIMRIRRQFDLADPDLLHTDEELESDALRRQELLIAYVRPDPEGDLGA